MPWGNNANIECFWEFRWNIKRIERMRLLLESLILFLTVFMFLSWEYNLMRHFVSIDCSCTRCAEVHKSSGVDIAAISDSNKITFSWDKDFNWLKAPFNWMDESILENNCQQIFFYTKIRSIFTLNQIEVHCRHLRSYKYLKRSLGNFSPFIAG